MPVKLTLATALLLMGRIALAQSDANANANANPNEACCDDGGAQCCDDAPAPPPVIYLPLPPIPPPLWVPPPSKKKPSDDRFLLKISLGGAYQHMLGESVGGAALDVMLGAEDSHWGGGVQAGCIFGRTDGGLDFIWFRAGPGFEWHLTQRLRFGFGVQLGVLDIKRAVGSGGDQDMSSFSAGAHLDLSVDLVRGRGGNGLYVAGRLGGDVLANVTDLSPWSFLLSAGLGYRF